MALTPMISNQWLRRGRTPTATGLTNRTAGSLLGSDDPFVRMHESMDQLFDSLLNGGTSNWSVDRAIGDQPGLLNMITPQLDIAEKDDAYELSVELPGVDPENVELSADEDMLTIRAEKQRTREGKDDENVRFHRVERSAGRFERSLSLPVDADTDNISARFKNGVLEVSVPRRSDIESARGRRIQIESS